MQIAEQEVDVQAALVGLVDNDDVVGQQVRVMSEFGKQDAIGHDLDRCLVVGLVVEANRVTNGAADLLVEFLGDAGGDRTGSDATGLGVANHATFAQASVETDLG